MTWVPASRRGRRRRGYDQSEVLARAVARRLHARARRLLVRHDDHNQTGRSRTQRLDGPRLVPSCPRDVHAVAGAVVAVVDDVVTTGASLAIAGDALDDLAPARLVAVALAHRRLVP